MTSTANKQAGFSIIEAAIVVVIVGAIAAAGTFVYQHNQTKITDAAPNTNQQTTTTTPPASTVGYLNIKEWGVRLALNSNTASLYYYINPNIPNVAYLSLKTISDVAPGCAANSGGALAAIGRLTEAEQQAIVSNSTPGIAGTIHIGSYWYNYANSHADCIGGDAAKEQAIAKAQSPYNLQSTFKTLAADN
jgi:hypothetical protein